jgi:flagellar biosynthesis/type III secretory pathway M-ring protein FliF/YscJ
MRKLECDVNFYQVNSLAHESWYIIYSAFGSFYIPFLLLSIIYLKIFVRVRAPIKETQKQLIKEFKYMSLKPESSDNTTFASTNGANDNIKKNLKEKKNKGLLYTITLYYIIIIFSV